MWKVIAICGIDGAGKTTQIELLEKYLRKKGLSVKRVWFRWNAFFSYPFLALCRLLGYTQWKTIERSNIRYAERRFYMNKALAKIWPWLFTLDSLLHLIIKVRLWASIGYTVLCDRFILDVLVDMMCETKNYQLLKHVAGKLLLSLITKEDSKLMVIDVVESIAYNRKHDIPNVNYLKERRKLYLIMARAMRVPIINGEKEAKKVHKDVLKLLSGSFEMICSQEQPR